MKINEKKLSKGVRISKDTWDRLQAIAKKESEERGQRVSASDVMRHAIKQFVGS